MVTHFLVVITISVSGLGENTERKERGELYVYVWEGKERGEVYVYMWEGEGKRRGICACVGGGKERVFGVKAPSCVVADCSFPNV